MRIFSLLLLAALSITAQTYDLAKRGDLTGDLSKAKWRFHTGDDPRWALPDVDDSGWSLLDGNKPWDRQGYKQYSGFAWYRIRVAVADPKVGMRISIDLISDAFEVFADGVKVGQFGSLSADAKPLVQHLPPELVTAEFVSAHPGETVIAVRVWHWPRWALFHPGGFAGAIMIGPAAEVQKSGHLQQNAFLLQHSPGLFIGLVALFAALYALLLFRRDPSATEYFWFALNLLCGPVFGEFTGLLTALLDVNVALGHSIGSVENALAILTTLMFLSRFLQKPLGKLTRIFLFAQIPVLLADIYFCFRMPVSISMFDLFNTLNSAVYSILVLYIVLKDVRTSRDARMLALPMSIFSITPLVYGIDFVLSTAGLTTWTVPNLLDQPVSLDYLSLGALLYLGITAYILTERFAESRSRQTRLRTEVEAAQQVQQLLLQQPPASRELPIEVAYLPANEVGGDFFKVFPQSGGSVLVIVGDVSGKGLKAAMLVAGIIGALELITAETSSPGEILRRLNDFLVNKSSGGFVTCACARILANGEVTLASAGHLPPYLDAVELEMESSLPLGIASGLEFSECVYRMQAGSRLAFMTDGVVEATNRSGELFGFDRTRDIAAEAPERIAERARAFGQTDDITVLQIRMAAAALA